MKCGDICTGDLRQKIDLFHEVQIADGRGGFDTEYKRYATVRARVDTPSAAERFFAQGQEDIITHRFILRYRSDIKSTDVLRWRGEMYTVRRPVDIEGRKKWTQLDASLSRVTVDTIEGT